MYESPAVSVAEIAAHKDITSRLLPWANLVHELARDQVARLAAINPNAYTGQNPFPLGHHCSDEDGYERYYETVHIGYALAPETGHRVYFCGTWYRPTDSGWPSGRAEIWAPAEMFSETEERAREIFEEITARRVDEETAERDELNAKLELAIDGLIAERAAKQ